MYSSKLLLLEKLPIKRKPGTYFAVRDWENTAARTLNLISAADESLVIDG